MNLPSDSIYIKYHKSKVRSGERYRFHPRLTRLRNHFEQLLERLIWNRVHLIYHHRLLYIPYNTKTGVLGREKTLLVFHRRLECFNAENTEKLGFLFGIPPVYLRFAQCSQGLQCFSVFTYLFNFLSSSYLCAKPFCCDRKFDVNAARACGSKYLFE